MDEYWIEVEESFLTITVYDGNKGFDIIFSMGFVSENIVNNCIISSEPDQVLLDGAYEGVL